MPYLQRVRGDCPWDLLEIDGECNVIGRHPTCDIHLDSPSVRRQEVRIVQREGRCYLEDIRCCNGTTVNGVRLIEYLGPVELKNGDQIRIAEFVFVFFVEIGGPSDLASGTSPAAEPAKPQP